jgi:alpha-galactosidase
MSELVDWGNAAVRLRLSVDDGVVRIVNIGPAGHLGDDVPLHLALNPVELQFAGDELPQGSRHVQLGGTAALRYRSHSVTRSKLTLVQFDAKRRVSVSTTWQVFSNIAAIRSATVVTNEGSAPAVLEYLSSFSFNGFADFSCDDWAASTTLAIPNNTFCGEFQWVEHALPDLGIDDVGFRPTGVHSTKKRVAVTSVGTNPTAEYLPMGAISDRKRGVTWAWQIEHNGSWHWEVGDHLTRIYLTAGGPTDQEHHWREVLAPGDSFESVPTALVTVAGGLTDVFAPLTSYRRAIRRTNDDNRRLPVVFNDYMNALVAEPTEAKLLPLIAAAARVGCEYFCVDAGWYSDESDWWKTVGEWKQSAARFPHGLSRVFDEIRAHGMSPGLWIEPEVVGIASRIANELPDSAFFVRNGSRVNAAGRYQLDFRSPIVIERMDAVIHRIVTEYGLGYLKFDYNVNAGVGTDFGSSSAGSGLIAHNRAYLAWIDRLLERYPNIVIEACASGGGRADYATLQRHSITSTSDQTDPGSYRRYWGGGRHCDHSRAGCRVGLPAAGIPAG